MEASPFPLYTLTMLLSFSRFTLAGCPYLHLDAALDGGKNRDEDYIDRLSRGGLN